MADYNDIKQSIATNLPDNNRREITAARLRDTLNGFVDKVQETETGIEGKVSTNESNIGNLSGRMDTNEANVTNLTGRVDSLEQTVENLPSGEAVKVVDNLGFGGAKDAVSAKWVNAVAALAGMSYEEYGHANNFIIGKATVHPGYLNDDGSITNVEGYSYFEYELTLRDRDAYITIPAYGGNIVNSLPEGVKLGAAFYNGDSFIGRWFVQYQNYVYSDHPHDMYPLEIRPPFNGSKVRGSLINGTFDPDNLYVIESRNASNSHKWDRYDKEVAGILPKDYQNIKLDGEYAQPQGESCNIAVIRLFKGDELEAESFRTWGAKLAVGDSANIQYQKTPIYQNNNFSIGGWMYYKADRDCYAFVSNYFNSDTAHFRVVRNSGYFDGDLQYQLMALAKRIKPTYGKIDLSSDGKGLHTRYNSGNMIVFKVPIIAGETLNYTLHSTGTFTLGTIGYWPSGQPIDAASITNPITFNSNALSVVGGDITGYALVTLQYSGEGNISTEIFNATYLEKNAQ